MMSCFFETFKLTLVHFKYVNKIMDASKNLAISTVVGFEPLA